MALFRGSAPRSRPGSNHIALARELHDAVSGVTWVLLRQNIRSHHYIFVSRCAQRAFQISLARRLERTADQVLNGRRLYRSSSNGLRLRHATRLPDLLRQYPGLGNIWSAQIGNWKRSVTLFAAHTEAFLRRLRVPKGAVRISQIQTDLSDFHYNGRSVIRVHFRHLGNWFYKPRSGHREAGWFRFLALLNDAGFRPAFLTARVVPSCDHCWMQRVPNRGWRSMRESELFYYRAGALLYLAHIFRAVDLHAENFVVHSEHPVLVDCETLFHPDTKLPQEAMIDENSVVRTGLLSRFTLECGRSTTPHLDSLPSVRGKLPIVRVRQQLARGFGAMHRFLAVRGNNADLKRAVRSMRGVESRYIYRPTWWYQKLVDESLAPHHLHSVGGQERFFRSRLYDGLCEAEVVRSEMRQLSCGDVPIFHGPAARARNELTDVECRAAITSLLC